MSIQEYLSHHFTLAEGQGSGTAMRLGIDNTPSDETKSRMQIASALMEQVRSALGNKPIHVDSWYRCEALEKVLTHNDYVSWCKRHGHDVNDESWALYFSRKGHPKGYAVDFICPSFGSPEEIVDAISKTGIKFDQLIAEGTWVHISADPMMRCQIMNAKFSDDGTPSYSFRK